jgi:hypothetical protein
MCILQLESHLLRNLVHLDLSNNRIENLEVSPFLGDNSHSSPCHVFQQIVMKLSGTDYSEKTGIILLSNK